MSVTRNLFKTRPLLHANKSLKQSVQHWLIWGIFVILRWQCTKMHLYSVHRVRRQTYFTTGTSATGNEPGTLTLRTTTSVSLFPVTHPCFALSILLNKKNYIETKKCFYLVTNKQTSLKQQICTWLSMWLCARYSTVAGVDLLLIQLYVTNELY